MDISCGTPEYRALGSFPRPCEVWPSPAPPKASGKNASLSVARRNSYGNRPEMQRIRDKDLLNQNKRSPTEAAPSSKRLCPQERNASMARASPFRRSQLTRVRSAIASLHVAASRVRLRREGLHGQQSSPCAARRPRPSGGSTCRHYRRPTLCLTVTAGRAPRAPARSQVGGASRSGRCLGPKRMPMVKGRGPV